MTSKRPAKVITGTADKKRFQVIKGPSDTRQIRCTNQKCRNMATQVSDGKGGSQYKCGTCSTVFKFTSM